jgi:hypothetical protein
VAETVLKKRKHAAALLEHLLRDGAWHDASDVRPVVTRTARCGYVTVLEALWAIGGEVENHGRGGSEWRLRSDAQPRPPRIWARRNEWAA